MEEKHSHCVFDAPFVQDGKTALHTALDKAQYRSPTSHGYSSNDTFGFAELCSKLVEAGVGMLAKDKVRAPEVTLGHPTCIEIFVHISIVSSSLCLGARMGGRLCTWRRPATMRPWL